MNRPHEISAENFSPRAPTPRGRTADADADRAPRITLHIEELVLHGTEPGDRYRIADAVQTELHRMISEQGAPAWAASPIQAPHLKAGPSPIAPSTRASAFGGDIARAVYQATAEGNPAS